MGLTQCSIVVFKNISVETVIWFDLKLVKILTNSISLLDVVVFKYKSELKYGDEWFLWTVKSIATLKPTN